MIQKFKDLAEIAPISTWALFGAGIVATIMQIFFVVALRFGWSHASEHDQLMYIGILAVIQALCPLAIVTALSKARVAAKGPGSLSFDVSSGGIDQPPATGMTVKTEVTKTP